MSKTKKKPSPAISPAMVTCDGCKSSVHAVATRMTKDGRRCIDCLTWSLRPVWTEAKKYTVEMKTEDAAAKSHSVCHFMCMGCNVQNETVEEVDRIGGSRTWLCYGCRGLEAMSKVGPMSLGIIDPVYDPSTDAPLELSRGIEKELQQALEDSLKFDGDVVSKAEHDAEVASLKEESDHYKRLLTRMLVGYVRNGSSFEDSCTITSPVILETVPLSAISFVEDTLASFTSEQKHSRLAVKIDPAHDPRVGKRDMAPWETEEKLKVADEKFNEVFFKPLKTVVDELTKRVSLAEPTNLYHNP
jgi:hypothetical protein